MSERTALELFNLGGRTALITGASGYLGRPLAKALAEAGANVIVSSRQLAKAERLASTLPVVGQAVHAGIDLDYQQEDSIRKGFDSALGLTGTVDILVNNGQTGPGQDCQTATREGFQEHFSNLIGYFELARLVHDHTVQRAGSASIVMMGSMYGLVGSYPDAYQGVCSPSPVAYHALKGGVVHLTRYLAVYWAADNVRVNCLSPGPFPNPETVPPALIPRLQSKSPLQRMGRPEELQGPLLLLCSDAGSYLTGHNLIVDGGWTAW